MDEGPGDGFLRNMGLDGPGRWLIGLAAVDLAALALTDAADALSGASAAGRLAEISSDLALVAAVLAALALVPVVGHGFFGAGWSSPTLGRLSSRVAPAGLWASLVVLATSVLCLLAHLALA